MKTLVLEVETINNQMNNEVLLGDFSIAKNSLLELAKLLELDKGEAEKDDLIVEADQWFLDNLEEEKREIVAQEFYNQTISRKDIHISYTSDLVATYQNTKIIAHIDFEGDEWYYNAEAKKYLEEQRPKYYLKDIKYKDRITTFEDIEYAFEQDDNWEAFTTDKDEYDWWVELANSLEYLENQNIDTIKLDIEELQDYIDLAKKHKAGEILKN